MSVKADKAWHDVHNCKCLTMKYQYNTLFIQEYWVIQARKRAHQETFPFQIGHKLVKCFTLLRYPLQNFTPFPFIVLTSLVQTIMGIGTFLNGFRGCLIFASLLRGNLCCVLWELYVQCELTVIALLLGILELQQNAAL